MNMSEEKQNTRIEICKLGFSESLKGLAIQDATLTTVRQCAGVLGTFSGLVATLLGREVIPNLPNTENMMFLDWFWPALSLMTLFSSLVLVFLIIKPRSGWIFHMNGNEVIQQFADNEAGAVELDVMYKVLTKFTQDNHAGNEKLLNHLFMLLSILLALLLTQIFSWLMALF